MPEPVHTLSQEQQSVLATTFHFLESATVYFRAVLPVVHEPDEQMLRGLVELAEVCLRRLPEHFSELQPLAEEWKKREGV